MRAVFALILVSACASGSDDGADGGSSGMDAGRNDAATRDTSPRLDARALDASTSDASTVDAALADASAPVDGCGDPARRECTDPSCSSCVVWDEIQCCP